MARLVDNLASLPPVFEKEKADDELARLRDRIAKEPDFEPLHGCLSSSDAANALLRSVFGTSPFLTGLAVRDPAILQDSLLSDPDIYASEIAAALERDVAEAPSRDVVMRLLRDYKRRIALHSALADLAGVWPVMHVTKVLTDAADLTIRVAVRHLLVHAHKAVHLSLPDPDDPEAGCGYFVIAMGKQGAYELNYSSDVDLMIFYDADRVPIVEGREIGRDLIRMSRELVRLLQERTADGYVFRTDLRLRPDPGATPIAMSTDAGLTYYESFGQNWERAALIKSRTVAGDMQAGEQFLSQLEPFIWRRYLDFAAVADIHAMKRKVNAFKGHGTIAVAGHNVKLGRGGIREIEFFTQTHQLIAGGRQPDLRGRGTLQMLKRLCENGWIGEEVVVELTEAYEFLRHVEHRLQMVRDEQTHSLPEDESELLRIARFSGFEDGATFAEKLIKRLTTVQTHYETLFEDLPEGAEAGSGLLFRGDDEDPTSTAAIAEIGFKNPAAVVAGLRAWQSGRYPATRSERARERLSECLPHLLCALGNTTEPDLAFTTFDRFVSELPAGVQLFSMLSANPSLLRLIADIMGTAPRLARVLSRRTRILDAVLDPGFFGVLPSADDLEELVSREVVEAEDYQEALDRARIVGREQAFLIGVRVISNTIAAEHSGGAYARLAGCLIGALQSQVEREMERAHGLLDGGQVAVVAMGKLGGNEMTAASDLDLITIYDFDADHPNSSGPKSLPGTHYYTRFTQRLISALSAPTSEGTLFEVDMRLRPSGNAGPVATQLRGFVDYQRNEAWTWEHLALARARVISGPPKLRQAIEETIRDVLCMPRDRDKVVADVREMRAKIEKEKGTDDLWELKQVRGGLVDLEFITQFLQVVSAAQHPQVLDQNTAKGLERLAEAGVLAPEDAEILCPAARLYHSLTQVLRLCLDGPFKAEDAPEGLKELLVRAADAESFQALEDRVRSTTDAVHAVFERLIK